MPAIIRGIYAYHTQSKGWSDVGYNFLVDRFGRIWEGRYGGVDRPVVGAHTLGYNDDAFAMSAIGNFETAQPSAAMLDAYGRLFAWKLSLHGVSADLDAAVGDQEVLPGHQRAPRRRPDRLPGQVPLRPDPGDPDARRAVPEVLRQPEPRREHRRDGPAGPGAARPHHQAGLRAAHRVAPPATPPARLAAPGFAGTDLVTSVGDVTGDGKADLLARTRSTGSTAVHPGDGAGHFGAATRPTARFAKVDVLTGVGDWNGDGRADVVGRNTATKRLYVYYGGAGGTFGATHRLLSYRWGGYDMTVGAGDLNGDKHPDLIARSADGRLWLVPGTGGALGTGAAAVLRLVRLRPDREQG